MGTLSSQRDIHKINTKTESLTLQVVVEHIERIGTLSTQRDIQKKKTEGLILQVVVERIGTLSTQRDIHTEIKKLLSDNAALRVSVIFFPLFFPLSTQRAPPLNDNPAESL